MSFFGYGPRQRATCSVLKESEGWQVPDHVCACVQTVLKHIIWRMDAPETIIIMVFQQFHVFLSFFGNFLDFFFVFFLGRVSEAQKKWFRGCETILGKVGVTPPPY